MLLPIANSSGENSCKTIILYRGNIKDMQGLGLRKTFEWLREVIDGKNIKILYEVRGVLTETSSSLWIPISLFPLNPFFMSVKSSKVAGIMYEINGENTVFSIKLIKNLEENKIKIKLALKGFLLDSVFKNHTMSWKVKFEAPHVHIVMFPINKSVKVLNPKGYILKKQKKIKEVIWKRRKGYEGIVTLKIA